MLVKKSIIFIVIYPFNDDYALKYGFDIIRSRGFEIIILNLFNVLFPKEITDKLNLYQQLDFVNGIEQVMVKDEKDFVSRIKAVSGWKISVLVVFPYIKVLRLLKKSHLNYILLFCNSYPPYPGTLKAFAERLSNACKRFFSAPVKMVTTAILSRLPYAWAHVDYPKYVVLGSDVCPTCTIPAGKSKVIKAHSFDYDRVLRNASVSKPSYVPNEDYYVHLECPPWDTHDYTLLNQKAVLKKEEYAAIINTFHDWLEKSTGKKVIIAAHPKHTQEENVYGGRPFVVGAEQLVKYSSGVFCHYSGAMKFAVIYRKPICVTSSRHLACDRYFQTNLHASASGIGAEINFIDTEDDYRALGNKGFFFYDEHAYAEYERKYITSSRFQNRLLWEIVLDEMLREEGISV
jgi:hypothetical protein